MFRVINVKYHKANKDYTYYSGKICKGDFYYRGFAVNRLNMPFEFFFTDDLIWERKRIANSILQKEFDRYQLKNS